ncbi:hypothetical protein GCM10011519_03270 [Marmoricola endophyticus]|uniref:DUF1800 domain-containing protein n=1 Tax=Marmoricola endophyticus TaxID=2040280 RepID=A0A917B9L3_9ACTN|nr:DUF1800 domain-containing protein [Marmoricola endophyticus]GGF33160.1 hypothetical protein GCM10011519_03270 [Marmoricola endophyticus]
MDALDLAPHDWRHPRPLRRPRVILRKTPASASPTPTSPAPSPTPPPAATRESSLHLLRRFTHGITPDLLAHATAAGGARSWFTAQLAPSTVPDPVGDEIDGWFAFLQRTPEELYTRSRNDTEGVWAVMWDLARWTVCRRLSSARQLQEMMVDFWSNHLNVPVGNDDAAYARVDYDKVIRANALGTFEHLLQAAVVHPAMGINLNNNVSTKKAPNENLGRELLELHTVGVDGGYTEADVKASARILTGYRVDLWPAYKAWYDTSRHATGTVSVMGFSSPNTSADGRAVTLSYLSYLAKHPKTARHIARKLCVKFVNDAPSDSLVTAVANAYTSSGTSIPATLLAMIDHPEFSSSVRAKLRNPMEDWIATVRALGIVVERPTTSSSFVNAMHWQYVGLGAAPYAWSAPNGYPNEGAAWASAGRMLNSFNLHRTMAAHYWPKDDATLPDLHTYLPALPATLQQVLDTVGTRLLGETPGSVVSASVAALLGWPLSKRVTARELNYYWPIIAIACTLLDSPLHLYR